MVVLDQLLREWPPGFGGVERVAHEIAVVCGGSVYSLDVQGQSLIENDPLPVAYVRLRLPNIRLLGRLHLPFPSRPLWNLLRSTSHLHGHLPSPAVLLILALARLWRPRRRITAHWHCFFNPNFDLHRFLFLFYQWLALRLLPHLTAVVTTSPLLAQELYRRGCQHNRVLLPCCLSQQQECLGLSLPVPEPQASEPLRLLFIGRLDSYKRLDWLFEALAQLSSTWELVVVGDGPKRSRFEELAMRQFRCGSSVRFLGRLSEAAKFDQLANADLLVLPSDCSNEAFGIVQLEAMVAGRIALALDLPLSGMSWVSSLPGFSWSQSREGLPEVLQRLADQPDLRQQLCIQSRRRYSKVFARSVWLRELQRFIIPVEGGMV